MGQKLRLHSLGGQADNKFTVKQLKKADAYQRFNSIILISLQTDNSALCSLKPSCALQTKYMYMYIFPTPMTVLLTSPWQCIYMENRSGDSSSKMSPVQPLYNIRILSPSFVIVKNGIQPCQQSLVVIGHACCWLHDSPSLVRCMAHSAICINLCHVCHTYRLGGFRYIIYTQRLPYCTKLTFGFSSFNFHFL